MKNILKKVAMLAGISLVGSSLIASENPSSIFVGANIGAAFADRKLTSSSLKNNFSIDSGAGWLIGAEAGYRHFLSDRFGFITYLSYDYMQTFSNSGRGGTSISYSMDTTLNQQLISANFDFFYNFTYSFGIYFGLGAGAILMQPSFAISNTSLGAINQKDGTSTFFALPLNAGFQFNINENQTITFGTKIPILSQDYASSRIPNTEKIHTYMVMLGYQYHFGFDKIGGYWGTESFK